MLCQLWIQSMIIASLTQPANELAVTTAAASRPADTMTNEVLAPDAAKAYHIELQRATDAYSLSSFREGGQPAGRTSQARCRPGQKRIGYFGPERGCPAQPRDDGKLAQAPSAPRPDSRSSSSQDACYRSRTPKRTPNHGRSVLVLSCFSRNWRIGPFELHL